MAFAFRKASAVRREAPSMPPAPAVTARPAPRPLPKAAPARPRERQAPDAPAAPPDAIAEAARLANLGRFVEAAQACEAHLSAHGPSAPALYLLGLVRDASGNPTGAESYYRKALYLDSAHGEALAHLALLMDTQGRPDDALVLRNRLRRLELANKS
jgi:chemotaxis protein methyltransferase WspC